MMYKDEIFTQIVNEEETEEGTSEEEKPEEGL